jgi:hypothetical protein
MYREHQRLSNDILVVENGAFVYENTVVIVKMYDSTNHVCDNCFCAI